LEVVAEVRHEREYSAQDLMAVPQLTANTYSRRKLFFVTWTSMQEINKGKKNSST
jgi:hypothetical protein